MMLRLTVATVLVCLSVTPASAGATPLPRRRPPVLLAYAPGTTSVARPQFMSFDEGWRGHEADFLLAPGIRRINAGFDQPNRIRWSRWGAVAVGRASYWLGPSGACGSTCHYIRLGVTVRASRVRKGRYTRLTIVVPRGPVVYGLRAIRIPANGTPGGLRASNWCNVGYRRCSTP